MNLQTQGFKAPGNLPERLPNWKLAWDIHTKAWNLKINQATRKISNTEIDQLFKSCTTETGFNKGIHIWGFRVALDDDAWVCLGLIKTKMFNKDNIFVRENFGFGFLNNGTLQNGSTTIEKFGPEMYGDFEILLKLDMLNGVLFFSFDNGRHYLEAFRSSSLKVGPLYPAVSFKNRGQVTLFNR